MARRLPARPVVAVDPATMEELLAGIAEDERALRPLRSGEVVEGVVASVRGDEALVALGGRSAGVLSLREASREGTDVAVGDRVVAAVVQPEAPDGRVVLSTRRARSRRQWTRMTELAKERRGRRGGSGGGQSRRPRRRPWAPRLRALSQLAAVGNLGATERTAVPNALRDYVGKRLPLKVIEADQHRDRLILSEKAAAQQLRRRRKEDASSQFAEGQVLDGTVASVTTFGVFVDVGVADGLVHRSEITWDKGLEATTLYRPGDSVRVLVTGVDRERGRISLSINRLGRIRGRAPCASLPSGPTSTPQ